MTRPTAIFLNSKDKSATCMVSKMFGLYDLIELEGKFRTVKRAPNKPALLPAKATTTTGRNVWQPGGLHMAQRSVLNWIMQLVVIFVKRPLH
jgi:hypothetical protein